MLEVTSKIFQTSVQNLSFVLLHTLDGLELNLLYSSFSFPTLRNGLARTNSECPTEVRLVIKVICPAFSVHPGVKVLILYKTQCYCHRGNK